MSRMISFFILLAIIVVLGILSFEVLSTFLLPIFIALLLVVMFRPVHNWFIVHCKGRDRIAAGLTTLAILLIVLLPMLWILGRAASETVSLVRGLNQEDIMRQVATLRERMHLQLPPDSLQQRLKDIEDKLREIQASASSDDGGEFAKRQLWAKAKELQVRVANIESNVEQIARERSTHGAAEISGSGQALLDSYAALMKAADAVKEDKADPKAFQKELTAVSTALAAFHEQLFGSPLIVWLKSQINVDETQVGAIQTKLKELAGPLALGTTQYVGSFLIEFLFGLSIMIISLYYFLADGPDMVIALMRLSPLDDRYEEQILTEFGTLTRAVIVAMLLAAFIQGLLAGVGYFFAGFSNIFLLTVLTMVFAMVPFIGATAVWGVCCLWLFVHDGRPQAAIVLAIYGTVIVSLADNLIKPMVLHGRSNLHPLLALLSVLGGAKALGPIGIVVGPMAVAFLQTVLVMLRSELSVLEAPQETARPGPSPSRLVSKPPPEGSGEIAKPA